MIRFVNPIDGHLLPFSTISSDAFTFQFAHYVIMSRNPNHVLPNFISLVQLRKTAKIEPQHLSLVLLALQQCQTVSLDDLNDYQ